MNTPARRKYDRSRYRTHKSEGTCGRNGCYNEPIKGEVLCDYHKSIQEERRQENREKGLCRCGRERSGKFKSCETCLKHNGRKKNASL